MIEITRKFTVKSDPLKRALVEFKPRRNGIKFWLLDADGIATPATKRGRPKEAHGTRS